MPLDYGTWNEVQGKTKALIAQKGEPFQVGRVIRRDVARRLVWVSGFGQEPIPMMSFDGDIAVYDEWREFSNATLRFTSSQTYIPNPSATEIEIELIGGGGGGGGCGNSPGYGGGGGGAGAYVMHKISEPFPVAGYAIVIGAGGTAGLANGGLGGDGGATTFIGTGVNLVANGGKGATGTGDAGAGGSGSGADFSIDGEAGHPGVYTMDHLDNTDIDPGTGGNGGSSRYGAGGRGGFQIAGKNGKLYGSGGGGGGRVIANNSAGGSGSAGLVIVKEARQLPVVQKKFVTATPHVPQVGEYALVAHHLGSRELPKCIGVLQSTGFAAYDPGLE
jgi:Glycine-rich domain